MRIGCFGSISQLYLRCKRDTISPIRRPFLGSHRQFSFSPRVFSFGYLGRTVTLEFHGIRSLTPKSGYGNQYAASNRLVEATLSVLSSCDALAVGVGMHEMAIINQYLESQRFKGTTADNTKAFKNVRHLIRRYRHYIDLTGYAASIGKHIMGIGRSKYSEAASFGESASRNKIEVLRLLSLYLRKGNVLKDAEMLQEFKVLSPSLYQAVVTEGAFYSLCRLHEHIYNMGDNSFSKRHNIKVLVVVDDWILDELLHLARTKLPILIADKSPPMLEVLEAIDNRSRQKWSSFLLQFVVMPMFVICSILGYKLYTHQMIRGFRAPLSVGDGFGVDDQRFLTKVNHRQHALDDTSRD